ncbi:Zn-dependent exopeptidase [Aaosphaeria arxii CBS 175.79]|uniref:Peptide hydrolase n=1 Tax=Aaosphaeria arxii CBS 175.79 TaxID=1450172 RepID=A0A6A5XZ52_9PLEO|nr:Zn-dependent exopeptidase [Aaosphaeria arxii CBS 175.79]KAF2018472.1 Zn-dependent exopeptidase [Aaosphaeria arxii CBS 175.79]
MAIWKSIVATAAIAATVVDAGTLAPRNGYKSLVDSKSLRKQIKTEALKKRAETLQDIAYSTPGKNRVIGSEGHENTVKYIQKELGQFPDYYTVELQGVELSIGVSANLTANDKTIEVYAVTLAPSGHVSGPLVAVPNLGCEESDFTESLEGKIAIIYRGTCEFGIKVGLAVSKGAIGVIAYNNGEGTLEGYSLQKFEDPENPYVPVGGISQGAGEALVAQLEAGQEVTVDLTTVTNVATSYNVIAQTKGGDQENVIHLGGHSDSVTAGPGINDNGSGTSSLLEVAAQLTRYAVKNAVRFSWWTAEEAGLLGATYYVSKLSPEEKQKIRLFLDFDMMASPNYAFQIYDGDGSAFNSTGPPGSAEAEAEFTHYFADIAAVNHTEIEFDGRSDYGPFLEAGIAAGGIACGAEGIKTEEEEAMFGGAAGVPYDVNYHEDGDTVNNLNYEAWIEMTKAIAHVTAVYARSFDSLPPKNSTSLQKRAARYAQFKQTKRFQKWV